MIHRTRTTKRCVASGALLALTFIACNDSTQTTSPQEEPTTLGAYSERTTIGEDRVVGEDVLRDDLDAPRATIVRDEPARPPRQEPIEPPERREIGLGNDVGTAEAGFAREPRAPRRPMAQERRVDGLVVASMSLPSDDQPVLEIESHSPEQVRMGESFEQTLVVRNVSDQAVHGVTVMQELPNSMEVQGGSSQPDARRGQPVEASGPSRQQGKEGQQQHQQQAQQQQEQQRRQQQGQQQGQQQQQASTRMETTRLGTLQAGEQRELRLRGIARSQEPLAMCVAVEYTPALCTTIEVVQADLEVALSLRPEGAVYICDDYTATLGARNLGAAASEPVTLMASLPDGLQTADGSREIEIEVGPIPPGETFTRDVQLDPQRTGSFEFFAIARAGEREVMTAPQRLVVVQPELSLTVDGPQSQYLGRPLGYQVRIQNTGEVPARDVQIELLVPEQAQRLTASTRGFDPESRGVRVDQLAPGESRTVQVQFDMPQAGEVQFAARATAFCVEEVQDQVQTRLEGVSAIQIAVVDREDPVRVDGETSYEIRIMNEGTSDDLNIQLEADLPESLEFVRGEGPTKVQAENGTLRFGSLDRLAPGDVATWNITVRALQEGQVRFEVRMTSDANDEPVTVMEPTTLIR